MIFKRVSKQKIRGQRFDKLLEWRRTFIIWPRPLVHWGLASEDSSIEWAVFQFVMKRNTKYGVAKGNYISTPWPWRKIFEWRMDAEYTTDKHLFHERLKGGSGSSNDDMEETSQVMSHVGTRPINAIAGSTWIDTTTGDTYIYDGYTWIRQLSYKQQATANKMIAAIKQKHAQRRPNASTK
jgi:hypothetical protein